jgi:hypothetical protein
MAAHDSPHIGALFAAGNRGGLAELWPVEDNEMTTFDARTTTVAEWRLGGLAVVETGEALQISIATCRVPMQMARACRYPLLPGSRDEA